MRPDEAEQIVALAVRAPSLHNTQPWTFVLRKGVLEIRADRTRQLMATDPDGRQLVVSCGAALFGARLAVRGLGHLGHVELCTGTWEPDLLARLHVGQAVPAAPEEVSLMDAVPGRYSLRAGFAGGAVDAGLLDSLRQAAASERGVLLLLDEPDRRLAVAELVATADRAQRASPEVRRELAQWTSRQPHHADGVPAWAYPDLPPTPDPEQFAIRDFLAASSRPARSVPTAAADRAARTTTTGGPPVAAALLTRADTRVDWLHAGQALYRLLLTAAAGGVQASLHSQPFGLLGLRRLVRGELTGGAEPQLLLQLGHPIDSGAGGRATPRRPVADVLSLADGHKVDDVPQA